MDKLDYLSTFVSLILGLGVANVLAQLSGLVKRSRAVDWYALHALWGAYLLLAMAAEWWVLLQWGRVGEISFFAYLALLLKPSILFFASDLLFPDGSRADRVVLKEHFFRVHRTLFLVFAAYPAADVLDTLLKGWAHFQSLGPVYPAIMAIAVTMSVAAAFIRDERYHWVYVSVAYLGLFAGVLNALSSVR